MAPDEVFGSHGLVRIVDINRSFLAEADYGRVDFKRGISNDRRQRVANRRPPEECVSRRRLPSGCRRTARGPNGLRCLTVRVSDRLVHHLISTGYLSMESSELAAYVAFALEACICG